MHEDEHGTGSTATINIQAGDDVTCTYTNKKAAKLTTTKVTDPASSAQDFAFTATGSGTSNFSLDTDADPMLSNTKVFTFDGNQLGSKSITESATSGWTLTSLTCTKTNMGTGSTATINIQAGDDVTCTYTDEQAAKLTIVKDAQPNDAQDFAFTATGSGTSGFSLDDDADGTLSNTKVFTFDGNQLGSKSVTEGATSGWTLTSLTCTKTNTGTGSTATVDIQAGDDVTCTFTNKKAAKLTIVKDAQPNAAQDFAFTATGSGTADFNLDDDADGTLSNTKVFTFDGNQLGSKSVTESATSGWSLTSVVCTKTNTGSGATATVDIQAGDDVTCTYTNRQDATVQVIKDAQPNSAQDFAFTTTGLGAGFSLDDDADGTLSNTKNITVTAGGLGYGSKSIAETATPGWTLTSTSCQNGNGAPQSNATINVQPGDSWVCTFTNKQDGKLTIVKDAQPNNAQDFAFTATGSGTSGFSLDDDADGTLSNTKVFTFDGNQLGSKSVTEGATSGWTLTSLTCTKTNTGTGSTATVDIQAGDDVTCTFTNKKAAKLTIVKDAQPNAAQDFAFTATGSGTADFNLDDDADGTLSNTKVFTFDGNQLGSKSVTESATSGWSLTSVVCTKTNTGSGATATVDIQPGDDVTCTFTNRQDATVQVVKDAQPNSAQDFAFTTTGLGAGFSLDDDADGTLSNTKNITVTAGGLGYGSSRWPRRRRPAGRSPAPAARTATGAPQSNATIDVQRRRHLGLHLHQQAGRELTIVKDAQPNDAQDFAFTATGSGTSGFSLDDDADGTLSQHEDVHVRRQPARQRSRSPRATTSGWTLTSLTCTKTNTGTGSTATVDIQAGDDVTCTFTNKKAAKLTIVKDAQPNAAQDFAFTATGSGTADFNLDDDADGTLSNTKVFTFDGNQLGSKSVTESATSGWSLTSVVCTKTNTGSGATATVDIQAGDDVTCTYTNRQDATVQVVKDAQPNSAQDFAFTTTGLGAGFSLDDDADGTLSNTKNITVTAGGLGYGSKSIAETATPGWTLTSTSCQNGNGAPQSNATINVQPGDSWVCTFTNKQDGKLTIVKDAQPNDAQDFAFTTTGSGTADFTLDDDADGALSNTKVFTFAAADFGTKLVTEGSSTDWDLSAISCPTGDVAYGVVINGQFQNGANGSAFGAGDDTIRVNATAGDDITCTYTNKQVNVKIVKSAEDATIDAGDQAKFSITVTNDGPGLAKGVKLSDPLPAGLTWTVGGTNAADCVDPVVGNIVDCSFGDLAAGQSRTITLTATTSETACTEYVNKATVKGSNFADKDDTATITCQTADIKIVKSAEDATIDAGDQAKFSITVTNDGPGLAKGVKLSDPLPAGLTWTVGGTNAADCVDPVVGNIVDCSFGDLAAGQSRTITLTATTSETACTEYVNKATVKGSNFADKDDTATITCQTADIKIVKSAEDATIDAGDQAKFSITVTNDGPGLAKGVKLSDPLPAGLTWTVGGTNTADCVDPVVGNIVDCSFGDLAAGQSRTITLTATTSETACTEYVNKATVKGSNFADKDDTATITCQTADIKIVKSAEDATIDAGDQAKFSITVTNDGPGLAKGVKLSDPLPAGLTWTVGGTNAADCVDPVVGNIVDCSFGDLAAGQSRTITLTATTSETACTEYVNKATVTGATSLTRTDTATITARPPTSRSSSRLRTRRSMLVIRRSSRSPSPTMVRAWRRASSSAIRSRPA